MTNSDKAIYAIPSGLIASVAFGYYADSTIALYIMWKMLQVVSAEIAEVRHFLSVTFQMTYNWGIEKGYAPKIPGFTVLLYCASTALLFHAATLEPLALRPSYWKFLYSISGGRLVNIKTVCSLIMFLM